MNKVEEKNKKQPIQPQGKHQNHPSRSRPDNSWRLQFSSQVRRLPLKRLLSGDPLQLDAPRDNCRIRPRSIHPPHWQRKNNLRYWITNRARDNIIFRPQHLHNGHLGSPKHNHGGQIRRSASTIHPWTVSKYHSTTSSLWEIRHLQNATEMQNGQSSRWSPVLQVWQSNRLTLLSYIA